MQAANFDDLDKRLLNQIQGDFPLVERPYATLAARLNASEAQVLARVAALRDGRIIRQISAIFDTRALGYQSGLVAARYAPWWLPAAAAIISAHPGVSHNYERDSAFNLWYTIAVPPGADLPAHLEALHQLSAARVSRLLPALRVFKIGVDLDVTGERAPDARSPDGGDDGPWPLAPVMPLTARMIALIRELQADLPATPEPFAPMAARLGLATTDLLDQARHLQINGVMRRYGAVLAHRRAGFGVNGMAVWRVADDQIEMMGRRMARFQAVSHCYQRPVYVDWPYSLFTMIHARTQADYQTVVNAIQAATGIEDYSVLFSLKEFKKTRVKYFDPALAAWEREHLAMPTAADLF